MPDSFNIKDIFLEYKNKIYRLALSVCRNEKDAEDALQNTFLKIIQNIKKFRHQSSLSTWIYRISYNEALMIIRKRKHKQIEFSDSLDYEPRNAVFSLFINEPRLPDEQLWDDEFKERIKSAIEQMPIQYRMPLLLHNMEGLPVKESAKVLGLKINSLKTRLHRAYMAVRSEVSGYLQDKQDRQDKAGEKCDILLNFVYDYETGKLDKEKESNFKSHIKDCTNCNSFLEMYRKAINITKSLQCRDIPLELKAKIENFIKKP